MRNFKKLLCVALALVVALTAASCSLSKQYAYEKEDIKLPVGVYINYLYQAYSEAQSYAQQLEGYDSSTGRYNGKKSFLKLEITDSDNNTAVAEDWIKDKAKEYTQDAIATYREFLKLGATIDELGPNNMYSEVNPYSIYNYQTGQLDYSMDQSLADVAKNYEQYGIGFEAWLFCNATVGQMKTAAFNKEYAEDGPSPVKKDEIQKYFTDNYTSYSTISADLYKSETADDDSGESTDVALSAKEIKKYEDAFKGYAKEISGGAKMDDIVAKYNEEFGAETSANSNVTKIDKDTTDELNKAILALKEGEATYKIIGEEENSRVIYLIYRAPIKDSIKDYVDDENQRASLLHEMKDDAFDAILDKIIEDGDCELSSACNGYQPSMFEKTK